MQIDMHKASFPSNIFADFMFLPIIIYKTSNIWDMFIFLLLNDLNKFGRILLDNATPQIS